MSVNADITVEPFTATIDLPSPITLGGGLIVDAGLDDIVIQGNPAQPLAVQASGVPGQPIGVDLGLDNIKVTLEPLTIEPLTIEPLTLNPLTITLTPLSIDLKLEPVKMDLGLDNMNLAMSLAITEMPRMKVNAPVKFDFGFGLLGMQLANFTVCGETGFTTEDNPPHFSQVVCPERKLPEPAIVQSKERPFRITLED